MLATTTERAAVNAATLFTAERRTEAQNTTGNYYHNNFLVRMDNRLSIYQPNRNCDLPGALKCLKKIFKTYFLVIDIFYSFKHITILSRLDPKGSVPEDLKAVCQS